MSLSAADREATRRACFMTGGTHFKRALGRTMKRLRHAHGARQGTVAKVAGLSQPAWARLEAGQTGIDLQAFVESCVALCVDPLAALESVMALHRARGGRTRARGDGREIAMIVVQSSASRLLDCYPLTHATAAIALARVDDRKMKRVRR